MISDERAKELASVLNPEQHERALQTLEDADCFDVCEFDNSTIVGAGDNCTALEIIYTDFAECVDTECNGEVPAVIQQVSCILVVGFSLLEASIVSNATCDALPIEDICGILSPAPFVSYNGALTAVAVLVVTFLTK
eukprot:CAMPEP_0204823128 /NCGR_PEP_ID=MMETSP1346-20131115/1251_1 /ASSEMBLY_ACC=CAM_ASM_000771 /TAXON_ID=215587 /ORGANISM="Aplanochytrium stocchinoi, Strain GSBS06" /LENGTH=136 /DNA_ID=CAMNT_0051949665 /DNA_START=186 /DNA_END=596 /DNA_ORIENTATION=-